MVAFTLDGSIVDDPWKRILVAYNDEPDTLALRLPPGTWQVVANSEKSGLSPLSTLRGEVILPPYSLLIAHTGE